MLRESLISRLRPEAKTQTHPRLLGAMTGTALLNYEYEDVCALSEDVRKCLQTNVDGFAVNSYHSVVKGSSEKGRSGNVCYPTRIKQVKTQNAKNGKQNSELEPHDAPRT